LVLGGFVLGSPQISERKADRRILGPAQIRHVGDVTAGYLHPVHIRPFVVGDYDREDAASFEPEGQAIEIEVSGFIGLRHRKSSNR
jgi:hypothetical protein